VPFGWSEAGSLDGDSCASRSILRRSVVQFERASGALPIEDSVAGGTDRTCRFREGWARRPQERRVVRLGNSVTPPEYARSRERDRVIDSRTDLNRQAHRRREHRDESVLPHPVVMHRHRSVLSGCVRGRVTDRRRRCIGSDLAERLVRPVSSGHTRHRGHRRRRVPSVSMSRCG